MPPQTRSFEEALERLDATKQALDAARTDWFRAKADVSALRRQTMAPVEAAIQDIGRKRHRLFAKIMLDRLRKSDDLGTALKAATAAAFPRLKTSKAITAKVGEMGKRPEIIAVISAVFSAGDLSMADVVRRHAELINDPNPRIAYKAIKEYWRLAQPNTK